jgi:hypothetical protein
MWPTIEKWNTKPLARTNSNIHPKLTRGLQDRQGHEIRSANCHCSIGLRFPDHLCKVMYRALRVWILEDHPGDVLLRKIRVEDILHLNFDFKRFRSSLDTTDGLGMEFIRQDKALPFVLPGYRKIKEIGYMFSCAQTRSANLLGARVVFCASLLQSPETETKRFSGRSSLVE